MKLLHNDSDIIHFDLLKLPHHGSNNNVEEDFFRSGPIDPATARQGRVRPERVLIARPLYQPRSLLE